MTARQQWMVVLAVVTALAAGLSAAMHFLGDELFPVVVGSKAPHFRAATVTPGAGNLRQWKTLDDYRGQVVFLNIWATWCPPCKEEMPSIQRLHEAYGPKGLKVVAVSIDDAVGAREIREFARRYGLTFEILHDSTHSIDRAYQTTGYPETFIIGRDGTIRKKWIGPADWNSEANRALVAGLLGVPPVPATDSAGSTLTPADTPTARTLEEAAR